MRVPHNRWGPVACAMVDRLRAQSVNRCRGWHGDEHGGLPRHFPALGMFLAGISALGGGGVPTVYWHLGSEGCAGGEGSGYRPSPCDPPAKRRPSVVRGGLRAHAREFVSPPPPGGGGGF